MVYQQSSATASDSQL